MAKLCLLFMSLLVLTISCNKSDCSSPGKSSAEEASSACPAPVPEPAPEPLPEPTPTPEPDEDEDEDEDEEVPHEAMIFETNMKLYNFEKRDEEKVYQAVEIIKKVIGSREFRSKVLNYTYNGKKEFVDNKGLSNGEIYQILLDGKEDLVPVVDHEMDLELELYHSWTSTVGYTYPNQLRIYMNTKFFDPYTPAEVAGNVFHEWTHKLGFTHDSSYSKSRDSSVPYAIGYLIRDLGRQYE